MSLLKVRTPHPVNMSGAIRRLITAATCSSATMRDQSAWPIVEQMLFTCFFSPSRAMAKNPSSSIQKRSLKRRLRAVASCERRSADSTSPSWLYTAARRRFA